MRHIKGIKYNIICDDMTITKVNRVLLAGLYIVGEVSENVGKQSMNKTKEKDKSCWHRRMERNNSNRGKI